MVCALLFIIALGMIGIGASQLMKRHDATTGPAPLPSAELIVTEDTTEPDEAKVTVEEYQVAPDMPRLVSIPSIDSSGPIQKIGVTKENAIAAPSNVHFAGWYTSSVKPGDVGLSIIDGHVSGKYVDGIFKRLNEVKPGDQITVEYGDKSQKTFEVVDIKTLPEAESAGFFLSKQDGIEQQLNLITCGGKFDRATQKYADRVIVVAKLITKI